MSKALRTRHTRISSKGQLTIPKEMREALGMHESDPVELVCENNELRVRRVPSWKDLAGTIPAIDVSPEEESRIAWEDRAQRIVENMG